MDGPIVKIKQGELRGKVVNNQKGGVYYSFQGIRYAKPPLGKLRFRAPQPPDSWEEIFDATKEGSECFSRNAITKSIVGSEDCLILNVYTPEIPNGSNNSLKPVMVWIHGGAFMTGSSKTELYGPDFLITEDVVLVTINYRIGVLGFLSLEDVSLGVPGNAGLKDMVMALKWIKNNITHFNGDPNNVTIFGESAGAAAVHYLVLSPMAKGLFHKAIAQSGSALNHWARGTRCSKQLAESIKFSGNNEKEILEFLTNLPVDKLFEAQENMKDAMIVSEVRPFGPVVEKISSVEPAFLSEEPIDIITSGKYNMVPYLTGYTDTEGMLFAIQGSEREKCYTNLETSIPYVLELTPSSEISQQIIDKIKHFYYQGEEPTQQNIEKTYILDTDNQFLRGIYSAIKNHVENSKEPIYFYRISVESNFNFLKKIINIQTPGVCHGDDIGYLFKTMFTPDMEPGSLEDISVKRFTKLWTTFARNGDPNPIHQDPLIDVKWKPVRPGELHFLDIGKDLTEGTNPEAERMAFWDDIYAINPKCCKF